MTSKKLRFVPAASLLLIALFACSSEPAPEEENPDTEKGERDMQERRKTGTDTSPTRPGPSQQTPGAESDPAKCAAEKTELACASCCESFHPIPQASIEKQEQAFNDCLCGARGSCKQECAATTCGGRDADEACMMCGFKNCLMVVRETCTNDPACAPARAALQQCTSAARCDEKSATR